MNMKVAGTIGPLKKKANKEKNADAESENSPNKTDTSMIDSECQSSNTNDVWDKSLFDGLTAKQKKNLRKKLQRQRKKVNEKSSTSNLEGSGKDDLSDLGNQDIGDINIDIDANESAKKLTPEKAEKPER